MHYSIHKPTSSVEAMVMVTVSSHVLDTFSCAKKNEHQKNEHQKQQNYRYILVHGHDRVDPSNATSGAAPGTVNFDAQAIRAPGEGALAPPFS